VSRLLVLVAVWVVQSLALLLLRLLLPGLHVASWPVAFGAAIVIALLNNLLWLAFIRVVERLNLLLFVMLTFLLNGVSVLIATPFVPGLVVNGLWTGFLVSLGLTLATTVLTTLFAFHDADYYTTWTIKRTVARQGGAIATDQPGFIFVQIDGLSRAVLDHALANGHVPAMGRWIRTGSHRLTSWEANLPCQTSASQAGILHGTTVDIPAFRWLEKESGRVLVSNHPKDARDIERRLSNGDGLLAL
jgi:uncharacterized membrane protein YvlD (DUF360 family)